MPPQQPYGPHQPAQPPQAPGSFSPHVPQYSYGTGASQHFQQHPSGQYEVLPPLPTGQNDGHSGHNPYDFIMNPNATIKGGGLIGSAFLVRIGLLLGGLLLLLIVAGVLITRLSPKGSTPGLTSIAERQQEMIRVSTAATQQTTTADGQNFVANVEATMTSSQQQIISYLASRGTKLNTKVLALDQSSATDTELASAATANDYDSAVTQNLTEQLDSYESLLQSTYKQATNSTVKAMLQADYTGAQLLLTQANNLSAELQQ